MTSPNEQQASKYAVSDEIKKKTGVYPIVDLKMVPAELATVPDLTTGGTRKRKYGLVLSITVVPDIDKEQEPLLLSPNMPGLFFDGDTLDDLKERAHIELEIIMEAAKEQVENASTGTADTRDKAVH